MIIKKLILIICLGVIGLAVGVQKIQADQWCGANSTCQNNANRGVTYIYNCTYDPVQNVCVENLMGELGLCQQRSSGCPSGAYCCGFYYAGSGINKVRCGTAPTCQNIFETPWYDCCTGSQDETPPGNPTTVNCSGLTSSGGTTLTKGVTYSLGANYDFTNHLARKERVAWMKIIGGTTCPATQLEYFQKTNICIDPAICYTWGNDGWDDLDPPAPVTFSWTPSAAGTYTIYCGSAAAAQAVCTGFKPPHDLSCDPTNNYVCNGPYSYTTVTVVDPAVNGACAATHYDCAAGTSANNVSGNSAWTWNCNGTGGGTNASCSENKPCTVQGNKVLMPDNKKTTYPPAGDPTDLTDSQPVYKNGLDPITNNPYFHSETITSTYSVPSILGHTTGHTLCYNATNCNTGAITPGNSVSVDDARCLLDSGPPYPFADLWWHYTPISYTAWWQVKDGDVTTNGNLDSSVPDTATEPYFDTKGGGGYPGIPAYAGSTSTLTGTKISETEWLANSGYNSTKKYDSAYFLNATPSGTIINSLAGSIDGSAIDSGGTADINGIYWYEYDGTSQAGDLTINTAANLLSRKVVLIVKGADVYLKGNINLTKGRGFFLLVAGATAGGSKGNIIVDSGVGGAGPNLEGIYVADRQFRTGTKGLDPSDPSTDDQLWVRGTVAAYGGVDLQRDLGVGNSTTPAELFEFAPDLEFLFPEALGTRPMSWQEVAP